MGQERRAGVSGAGDPWEEFCERLKRAGRALDRETTPRDALTRAEGYRKLVHLIRVGFDATLDHADTQHPRVYRSVTRTSLGEGETSDARYHQAFIDGSATYRVSGRRGEAPFVEFTVYAGKIGIQDTSRQVGAITESELEVDAEGRFEIVLSPHEHPGNWMQTGPDASLLYIREYSHDWQTTRGASFEIRRDGVSGPPAPLTLEAVQRGLERTAAFVEHSMHFWAGIVDHRAAAEPNRWYPISVEQAEDSPEMPVGHRFAAGYFRLAPDEALRVRFRPGEAPYWGLDLTNYWFEPLSYGEHFSHVNNRTARPGTGGEVTAVIADAARDDPNWLDTRGHREGVMLFRWSRSRDPVPTLESEVVKLGDL